MNAILAMKDSTFTLIMNIMIRHANLAQLDASVVHPTHVTNALMATTRIQREADVSNAMIHADNAMVQAKTALNAQVDILKVKMDHAPSAMKIAKLVKDHLQHAHHAPMENTYQETNAYHVIFLSVKHAADQAHIASHVKTVSYMKTHVLVLVQLLEKAMEQLMERHASNANLITAYHTMMHANV